jgi:hypothetical protein
MNPGQLYAQLWRLFRSIMADTQPELERSKLSLRSFFLLNKVDELPYPAQRNIFFCRLRPSAA